MDRTHKWYDLRDALRHRMVNESKWYDLPQFTSDYPALVYFHLHCRLLSKAWRHPDHIMRLCFRDSIATSMHSYIQFRKGGWMVVFTYGCAMRAPPRLLMRQVVRMDLHPRFAVTDMASEADFATFNRLASSWLREQEKIEEWFKEQKEHKSKLAGTSPYDELPALTFQ